MLKNYIKIAWRSLWKSKFYTIINVSGLAVGLATGIMLLLWVQNEWSYDKFNKDYENIYTINKMFKSNGKDVPFGAVPAPLAVFSKSMPDVEKIVRIRESSDQIIANINRTKILDHNEVAYADSSFFSIFTLPLVEGNEKNLFPNINSVVLTQTLAKKIFGNVACVGKTIQYFGDLFTVTGVLKDFPLNSSIRYDAIFPMGYAAAQFTKNGGNGDWKTIDEDLGNFNYVSFLKLRPNINPKKTANTLTQQYKKARNGDSDVSFTLQNLADVHLIGSDGNKSTYRTVQIFMLVVILLLVIASINYVNLSTARSLLRAKEVGVRKIIGANKTGLFLQFFTETVILFCLSTVLAGLLVFLLMPYYNTISGKSLTVNLNNTQVWLAVTLAILGTLAASSIYPAFQLSSFKPMQAIRGKFTSGIGVSVLRESLVVFQFLISIILLIGTMVISNQLSYLRNINLGYDRSYVFSIPLTQKVVDHLDAVKSELESQPNILNVAAADAYDFTNLGNSTGDINWHGKPANGNMMISQLSADKDFIPAMKIKFLEGTNFSGTPADSSNYILNETAVKEMSLKKPYVGQQISFHEKKGTIIGVVADFNFKSLKEKVTPLFFFNFWADKNILYVRTTAVGAQDAIKAAEKQYKKYAGDSPFSYSFIDKKFEAKYSSEQRSGKLFQIFAGIAIFISCLGLFGLATYMAQVKIREIGIRKVLGASVEEIVGLLSKDFIKLVFVALLIASPIAWWLMNKWLESFAYKITIQWWIFPLAGILAVLIAFATVSFQAIKAAVANPVKSLRTE